MENQINQGSQNTNNHNVGADDADQKSHAVTEIQEAEVTTGDAILNALIWLFYHTLFGLAPLIIAVIVKLIHPDVTISMKDFYNDGLLLFFCSVMASVVMIDFIFNRNVSFPRPVTLGIISFPMLLLFITGIIYSQLHFDPLHHPNEDASKWIQNIIMLLSLTFCIILKTIMFKYDG